MKKNTNVAIIGLPATGKTTYIAALWYLMMSHSQYCSLEIDSLEEGNQEYLNELSNKWASYGDLGRTIFADVGDVIMNLKFVNSNSELRLNIPDYYGEIFDEHFRDREWSLDYKELMDSTDGILLFIDPRSTNNVSATIMSELSALKQFQDANLFDGFLSSLTPEEHHGKPHEKPGKIPTSTIAEESISKPEEPKKTKLYQHQSSSNQVKIVDLLQFITANVPDFKSIKVSLIISAWDVVVEFYDKISPEEFLRKKLPLLYQFLNCNQESFHVKIFGVSAQGGDYGADIEILEKLSPEQRVMVYDAEGTSKDIAKPIIWLTE